MKADAFRKLLKVKLGESVMEGNTAGNLLEYGLAPEDVGLSPGKYCHDCLRRHTVKVFFEERDGQVVLVSQVTGNDPLVSGRVLKEKISAVFRWGHVDHDSYTKWDYIHPLLAQLSEAFRAASPEEQGAEVTYRLAGRLEKPPMYLRLPARYSVIT